MHLYQLNYPDQEKAICQMEMRRLFGQVPINKLILSNRLYEAGRSVYFKSRLDILYEACTIEALLKQISTANLWAEDFKIVYLKTMDDGFCYEERLEIVMMINPLIKGPKEMHQPKKVFGVTKAAGHWYFGVVYQDHQAWKQHQKKPQSYSQSLSVREARTLVNIASCGSKTVSLVDPCCGVGTVVLEALSLHHMIAGSDIHPGICWKANRNLEYFGFPKIIECQDIRNIQKKYEVSILDIPYNLYSHITPQEQFALIEQCYRISQTMILVSYEDLSWMLEKVQWQITDQCQIRKMKFQRYIYCCKKKGYIQ